MAVTNITMVDAPLNEAKVFAFTTPTSTTDGFEIDYAGADNRTAFLIENTASSEGSITFKAGDAIQGVEDVVVTVAASSKAVVWIDSGFIKNVANANKGKVIAIPSATTMHLAAVHLGRLVGTTVTW